MLTIPPAWDGGNSCEVAGLSGAALVAGAAGATTRAGAGAGAGRSIDWVVVCMHQVAKSSANFNGADLGIREEWMPLFDAYGVDLVVAGHEHHYERTYPVRGADHGNLSPDRQGPAEAAGQRGWRGRVRHHQGHGPHDPRRRRPFDGHAPAQL